MIGHTACGIQRELVRNCSSGSRSIERGWENVILPSREEPCKWVHLWNLEKSKWEQHLGKQQCIFRCMIIRSDKMMWTYPGVSQIKTPRDSFHLFHPCISVHLLRLSRVVNCPIWDSSRMDGMGPRPSILSRLTMDGMLAVIHRHRAVSVYLQTRLTQAQ